VQVWQTHCGLVWPEWVNLAAAERMANASACVSSSREREPKVATASVARATDIPGQQNTAGRPDPWCCIAHRGDIG